MDTIIIPIKQFVVIIMHRMSFLFGMREMSYSLFVQFVTNNSPVEVARRLAEFETERNRWRGIADYYRTRADLYKVENFELQEELEAKTRQLNKIISGIIPEMPAERD